MQLSAKLPSFVFEYAKFQFLTLNLQFLSRSANAGRHVSPVAELQQCLQKRILKLRACNFEVNLLRFHTYHQASVSVRPFPPPSP